MISRISDTKIFTTCNLRPLDLKIKSVLPEVRSGDNSGACIRLEQFHLWSAKASWHVASVVCAALLSSGNSSGDSRQKRSCRLESPKSFLSALRQWLPPPMRAAGLTDDVHALGAILCKALKITKKFKLSQIFVLCFFFPAELYFDGVFFFFKY